MTKTMAQMKEIDRIAIEERGIDSLWLMENAASAVADQVMEAIPQGSEISILCGSGNNGGDGIAAARLLAARGYRVNAVLCGSRERMTKDSLSNERRLAEAGLSLQDLSEFDLQAALMRSSCVIDALFGVGLKRPMAGSYARIAALVNSASCPVIACDIPSGLNGDTGEVMSIAVRADTTVTFSCAKPGLLVPEAAQYVGRLIVADIGIPEDLLRRDE